jgi:hypothetical protein
MVPPSEWVARGLEEPAPPYHLGEYDSTVSVPTPLEVKMYQLRDLERKKQRIRTVQQALQAVGLDAAASVTTTLFPAKPTMFMNLRHAFRYQPAIGFRTSIDGLHNIKVKAGNFCRVLYSVVPPSAFYQTIRLTSGVHFTTTVDWTSLPSSPEFCDGFVVSPPQLFSLHCCRLTITPFLSLSLHILDDSRPPSRPTHGANH